MTAPQPELLSPLGGFFEAHSPDGADAGASILDAWTEGRPYAAFVNARSAFAALVALWPDATIWLPAFICADLVSPLIAGRVRFYPVLEGFEPELAQVERDARAGDVVLVVAAFGLPVAQAARACAKRRPDLRLVEDRAQALGPGLGRLGGWTLYSPRKLLGVGDGGLLVASDSGTTLPHPDALADGEALWRASRLRCDDPRGLRNSDWHAANQAKEAAMSVTQEAMTQASLTVLATTSMASLVQPRWANWRRLEARLGRWSALPTEPGAPPLGYVLQLEPDQRRHLVAGLHADRIFAAIHWPRIAAPATAFPRETAWTRELVTLPCDHRYGLEEMDRIAARVTDLLR